MQNLEREKLRLHCAWRTWNYETLALRTLLTDLKNLSFISIFLSFFFFCFSHLARTQNHVGRDKIVQQTTYKTNKTALYLMHSSTNSQRNCKSREVPFEQFVTQAFTKGVATNFLEMLIYRGNECWSFPNHRHGPNQGVKS